MSRDTNPSYNTSIAPSSASSSGGVLQVYASATPGQTEESHSLEPSDSAELCDCCHAHSCHFHTFDELDPMQSGADTRWGPYETFIELFRESAETEAIESIPEQTDWSDDPLAAHVDTIFAAFASDNHT